MLLDGVRPGRRLTARSTLGVPRELRVGHRALDAVFERRTDEGERRGVNDRAFHSEDAWKLDSIRFGHRYPAYQPIAGCA